MAYTGTGSSSQTGKTAADDFTYKGSVLVRNPNFSPFTQWRDALWVHMIPLKLENQNSANRGGTLSIGGENRPTFAFLAPKTMAENITHTWDGFDSIQSRLMGKLVGAAKLGNEVTAMVNSVGNIKDATTSSTPNTPINLHAAAERWARSISGTDVPKFKVDTPLRYMDSARRQINLEFYLMAQSPVYDGRPGREKVIMHGGVKETVTDIVKDLMMYSAPAIKNSSSIEYEFPYIWRLETYPKNFLLYEYCALTAVQPTWQEPYIDGYPSNCQLTLSFQDLSPLFRATIKHGSVINVIDNQRIDKMSETEYFKLFEGVPQSVNKKDTIKTLLDARTKFKRAQAIQKSLTSGNEDSVLKYFAGRGKDKTREFLNTDRQRKIGDNLPVGKVTPNIVKKVPRL